MFNFGIVEIWPSRSGRRNLRVVEFADGSKVRIVNAFGFWRLMSR